MKEKRFCMMLLKYYPVVTAFCMWIHIVLVMNEIYLFYAESIMSPSYVPGLILLAMSVYFGFCKYHRMFIIYTLLVQGCIDWSRFVNFGPLYEPMLWVLMLSGLTLLLSFAFSTDAIK